MLRQALYDYAVVRHQFFNFLADQALSEEFNRLTNQLVALAKGQHNPGTPESATGGQKGGGKAYSEPECTASLPAPSCREIAHLSFPAK